MPLSGSLFELQHLFSLELRFRHPQAFLSSNFFSVEMVYLH